MVKNIPLTCSTILPGQKVAVIAGHHLSKVSELSQLEISTILMGHPVSGCLEVRRRRQHESESGVDFRQKEERCGKQTFSFLPKLFLLISSEADIHFDSVVHHFKRFEKICKTEDGGPARLVTHSGHVDACYFYPSTVLA